MPSFVSARRTSIGQLEDLGYVHRHEGESSNGRLVSLTDRGWKVGALQRRTVRALEREWSAAVGETRFATFLAVLQEIAGDRGRARRTDLEQ